MRERSLLASAWMLGFALLNPVFLEMASGVCSLDKQSEIIIKRHPELIPAPSAVNEESGGCCSFPVVLKYALASCHKYEIIREMIRLVLTVW